MNPRHEEAAASDHGGEIGGDGATPSVTATRDKGALRQRLEHEAQVHGVPLSRLTVLSAQRDPFRQDTDAGHRDAQWLAEKLERMLDTYRVIHLRGLHYMLLGQIKPNGVPYINDEQTWIWLSEKAAKAARWLGYVPFERIVDQRNAEPVIRMAADFDPWPAVDLGELTVELPSAINDPTVHLFDYIPQQPYRLAIYGEKSSLEPVLGPIADRYGADLFLPTGEISDTLMHTMAKNAAEDGRPMVMFTFSDCDPAGWQMPVSIGRKLQALKEGFFPDLEFQVRPVGLLPEHVKEYGLPSTPLKATEKRADKWTEAMGVDQTEIDALATLQPDVLREIARQAIEPFFDATLARRCHDAAAAWTDQAQAVLHDVIGPEQLDAYRSEAQTRLDGMREQLAEINNALRIDASDLALPPFAAPPPVLDEIPDDALISSAWTFIDQCEALLDAKEYRR